MLLPFYLHCCFEGSSSRCFAADRLKRGLKLLVEENQLGKEFSDAVDQHPLCACGFASGLCSLACHSVLSATKACFQVLSRKRLVSQLVSSFRLIDICFVRVVSMQLSCSSVLPPPSNLAAPIGRRECGVGEWSRGEIRRRSSV